MVALVAGAPIAPSERDDSAAAAFASEQHPKPRAFNADPLVPMRRKFAVNSAPFGRLTGELYKVCCALVR